MSDRSATLDEQVGERARLNEEKKPVDPTATIDVTPSNDTGHPFRASIYRGIGNVRKITPQGEVMARPGDVILEAPGGLYVIDALTASALFGVFIDDLLFTDPVKSQREREDLSSKSHPDFVKEQEKLRVEAEAADQDVEKRRENAREAALNAATQNIGGELKAPEMHVRNVGGEIRLMPGPHPALNNPELSLVTQEEKARINEENQSDTTGANSRAQQMAGARPIPGILSENDRRVIEETLLKQDKPTGPGSTLSGENVDQSKKDVDLVKQDEIRREMESQRENQVTVDEMTHVEQKPNPFAAFNQQQPGAVQRKE